MTDSISERIASQVASTGSLIRLRLHFVDILHCQDIEFGSLDQIVNETIPAMRKIRAERKTRFIGVSGLPLGFFKYVLNRLTIGSVAVVLSYCHYGVNDSTVLDLIPCLKNKGEASAFPLATGLLTENGPSDWHPASPELQVSHLSLSPLISHTLLSR
ncbi:hypothetical protein IEQ34_002957 [Dendrobium chrysotoxum]|uniref:NADP-dependent oxidoreductase domain-containing protein n=1 Tax=Dendrobium chrysotoxum TaxID=161865 RepID=A0AAV7H2D4_DENCH|nr:hypothetical protein IEQ34_002957 [Dendrobium chrysotoxum]